MREPFDYTEYTKLLNTYVDEKGMVDYKGLQNNRAPLDAFIENMGTLSPERYSNWREDHQLAFWINAYNAITLKEIINHYPIKRGGHINRNLYPPNSIRQIDGVWKKNTTLILDEEITLDAIEHKILRTQFNEPRMHFAIVCASISCPSLRNEAYEAEKLEDQLEDQCRDFILDNGKFRTDAQGETLYLSPIFDWFAEDFVGHYNLNNTIPGRSKKIGAVLDFINTYLDPGKAQYLTHTEFDIKYLHYDWSLNEQK